MITVQHVLWSGPVAGTDALYRSGDVEVLDATRAVLATGAIVSGATFFNAFPAAHWAAETGARSVRLRLEVEGRALVRVVRTDASGTRVGAVERLTDGGVVAVDVDLSCAAGGGWCWFEIEARTRCVVAGAWQLPLPVLRPGGATLGITTFDKPDYCVALLQAIAARPALADVVRAVVVVDQGSRLVTAQPGFAEVAERLGNRLRVIRQPNLGGSGGFSRVMLEALDAGDPFALLLDDDVVLEPDAVLRMVRLAQLARDPLVVGGQMLDLNHPTVLHALAEVVDENRFMWRPALARERRHDLAAKPLARTPWLHERRGSDYNGWWMSLLPTGLLARVGLSMPYFIKWDDAEFGLRAREAGVRTVALPGAALWHVAWLDKTDEVDWQSYFHARNRVLTAILHARRPLGGGLLADSLLISTKHLLRHEYAGATLRARALEDVLAGPGGLHRMLAARAAWARAVVACSPTDAVHRPGSLVAGQGARAPEAEVEESAPSGAARLAFTVRAVLREALVPVGARARRAPTARIRAAAATWWTVPAHDSLFVAAADGRGRWVVRDPRAFRRLAWRTVRLHLALAWRWRALRRAYRAAQTELTAPATWRRTLGYGVRGGTGRRSTMAGTEPAGGRSTSRTRRGVPAP